MRRGLVGAAAAAGLGWSLFEARWVETVECRVALPGLPPALDGFRILHLSDFHLGAFGVNDAALAQALAWAGGLEPDLAVVTGDLLTRRRGERKLRQALARVRARHGVFAVLGNHDVAESRDPLVEDTAVGELAEATLLADSATTFDVGGTRVQVAGVEPRAYMRGRSRPERLADAAAGLRILLSHFPTVVDRLPPGAFHLVLAGHMHGGQICLPWPRGKLRLAHLTARYCEGLIETPAAPLYVSRGLGTTFVPFRLLARPEVTLLTLRKAI